MDLSDLLNIVKVKESNITYCYTNNTLLNLTDLLNPITKRSLKPEVLDKARLMEWGWRGLFDIGIITGLYQDLPNKILIPPNTGKIVINKVSIDSLLYKITGDVYSVEVEYSDGTINPLFDIATEDKDKLETIVNELWNKGYFLGYWSSSIVLYSGNQNSGNQNSTQGSNQKSNQENINVIITDPLLISAGDTKLAGSRAMKYLSELI